MGDEEPRKEEHSENPEGWKTEEPSDEPIEAVEEEVPEETATEDKIEYEEEVPEAEEQPEEEVSEETTEEEPVEDQVIEAVSEVMGTEEVSEEPSKEAVSEETEEQEDAVPEETVTEEPEKEKKTSKLFSVFKRKKAEKEEPVEETQPEEPEEKEEVSEEPETVEETEQEEPEKEKKTSKLFSVFKRKKAEKEEPEEKEEVSEEPETVEETEQEEPEKEKKTSKLFSVFKRRKAEKEEQQELPQEEEPAKEKKKFFSFKKKEKIEHEEAPKKTYEGERLAGLKSFYTHQYKKLLIIPIALLVIAIIVIGVQMATTGDFVRKDVSLKGGITITIPTDQDISTAELDEYLANVLPGSDLNVRSLRKAGQQVGIIVDGSDVEADEVIAALQTQIPNLQPEDYTVEFMGSALGESFFKETLKAIYISFLFMGIVVFLYFGEGRAIKIISVILTLVASMLMFSGTPSLVKDILAYLIGATLMFFYVKNGPASFIVILNVVADVVITLAIINLMGMRLSTAGIAAFLMIIGYSVDTNILLSTKVLKRREGEVMDRVFSAMKTGLMMTTTTVVAITVALVFTQSEVIRQIMTILLIGLIIDSINTWIQNVGLLRIFLEKKRL